MVPSRKLGWLLAACSCVCVMLHASESATVTGDVTIVAQGKQNQSGATRGVADASDVVVWLTPLDSTAEPQAKPPSEPTRPPQIIQRNKTFDPHILAVEVGTVVEFPNKDPFFHNIFSLYDGKRFDLGLYEAGSTRSVRFDRPGVSFLFCNIHPEMSAVVIAVETPYFALSNRAGRWMIRDVPDGRYEMHVWYERSLPEDLKGLARPVVISASSRPVDRIRVVQNPNFTLAHKNKYGQDYVPPPSSGYGR
jgi:plastocyanin